MTNARPNKTTKEPEESMKRAREISTLGQQLPDAGIKQSRNTRQTWESAWHSAQRWNAKEICEKKN